MSTGNLTSCVGHQSRVLLFYLSAYRQRNQLRIRPACISASHLIHPPTCVCASYFLPFIDPVASLCTQLACRVFPTIPRFSLLPFCRQMFVNLLEFHLAFVCPVHQFSKVPPEDYFLVSNFACTKPLSLFVGCDRYLPSATWTTSTTSTTTSTSATSSSNRDCLFVPNRETPTQDS
jgi:hypothetical protein